jgi:Putative adhesin
MHRSAALIIALTAACFAAQAHAAEYTKSFALSGRPSVRVNSNDGGVTVRTGDTNQVEFRVIYKSLTLDRNLHIEATQQGDQLQLNVHSDWQPVSLGFRRLHIEVLMPKDGDLRVETSDGNIDVGNLSGNVDLHSGDGELKVSALKGVLRMNTSDGAINGDGLDGKLDANSGDGRIRLEGRFDELKVKTGDGSVTATAKAGSKIESAWTIQSGDGGIELTLPKDLQADVSASSGDGHVTSDIPLAVQGDFSKSKVNGKLNGGGAPLTIHTGDGSIHLRAG